MRPSLRRSCATCARSKHSCDLRTPRCSRCVKRKVQCSYANEPWVAPSSGQGPAALESQQNLPETSVRLTSCVLGSLDPFESYPQTRLPREQVERLIHRFLHKIAFQYYPLDLSATSNPFLVSWWPFALGDPALFHVSLQTACLDEELSAQKGFWTSEILMADSVALLRRKVGNNTLAVQDGTMNSIITLAAIEFGKGNIQISEMHIRGVKRLVAMRGGINSVRQTSPLTARMICWVSMLVMGRPQFATQDDAGIGDGIPPISEWQLDINAPVNDGLDLIDGHLDEAVGNVFVRLRHVFQRAQQISLPATQLHDLTCFVIHRLLLCAPSVPKLDTSTVTECLRYAIILFMFVIQGPTYYSHAVLLDTMIGHLKQNLKEYRSTPRAQDSLLVWILTAGMAASIGTQHYTFFVAAAQEASIVMQLDSWNDAFVHIERVLWLARPDSESIFRPHWEFVLGAGEEEAAAGQSGPLSNLPETPIERLGINSIS